VNVAVSPLYVTAPATAVPPGPATVNDDAVIVEGFIAMLKVALIVVLIWTAVAPLAGMVDTTDGTVTVSCPHPAMKTTNKVARKHVIQILYLRICNLSSNLGVTVSNACTFIALVRNVDTEYLGNANKSSLFGLYRKDHIYWSFIRGSVLRHIRQVCNYERLRRS